MAKITELLMAELDREMMGTRRALERVPEGQNDWKPHEKSMPLGYLAALVATMPWWIASMVNHLYHHRAQLTTYLRLNEKPVPSLYGPSADEPHP